MVTDLRPLGCAAVLLLAACATTTNPPASAGPPKTAAAPTCLTMAGTVVPASDPRCSTLRRSISSQEISTTGAVTATGALSLLDPSITVGH